MNHTSKTMMKLALAVAFGAGCLVVNENVVTTPSASWMTTADAIIGRPATPMSYAGVARRTTARAVTYGAPVVAAPVVVAPAPVVVAPTCVQAVDPYGRIYTRCY